MKSRLILTALLFGIVALAGCSRSSPPATPAAPSPSAGSGINAEEARAIAHDGFLFGLPLVYIALQADVLTNIDKPAGGKAPFNQFDQHREFPDAKNNKIVGMNVDTLYSLAQLDLTAEPIVLVIPPMDGKRWWIMQVLDAWNDVPAAPGSRKYGNKGAAFLIAGPKFSGEVPAGLELIHSDTSLVTLGGRTYTAGPKDYAAVHKIQDGYQLIPLSQWKGAGTAYTPPATVAVKSGVDDKTPIPAQVFQLSAQDYFNRLTQLLVDNPPRAGDAPMMERLAKLGIKPGANFSLEGFDTATRKAIEEGVASGQQAIREGGSKMGEIVNGWQVARDLGRYGTKYEYRAIWTYYGVGGNRVEDALYPLAVIDADGNRLDGARKYTLRFSKVEIPPVDAFWSITMYDNDSYLVVNPLNRYTLGDRSHLKFDKDGSLTIYIQSKSPGKDKERNWLPSPGQGPFKLALRLYVPKQQVIDGTWKPPAVKRVG